MTTSQPCVYTHTLGDEPPNGSIQMSQKRPQK